MLHSVSCVNLAVLSHSQLMSAAVVTLFRASNGAAKGDKGEEDPVLKALTALQAPYVLDVSAGVFQALQALLAKVVPLAEAEHRAGG